MRRLGAIPVNSRLFSLSFCPKIGGFSLRSVLFSPRNRASRPTFAHFCPIKRTNLLFYSQQGKTRDGPRTAIHGRKAPPSPGVLRSPLGSGMPDRKPQCPLNPRQSRLRDPSRLAHQSPHPTQTPDIRRLPPFMKSASLFLSTARRVRSTARRPRSIRSRSREFCVFPRSELPSPPPFQPIDRNSPAPGIPARSHHRTFNSPSHASITRSTDRHAYCDNTARRAWKAASASRICPIRAARTVASASGEI